MSQQRQPEENSIDFEIFFLMDRFGYTSEQAREHYQRQCEQRQLAAERAQANLIKKAMLRRDQQNYVLTIQNAQPKTN